MGLFDKVFTVWEGYGDVFRSLPSLNQMVLTPFLRLVTLRSLGGLTTFSSLCALSALPATPALVAARRWC